MKLLESNVVPSSFVSIPKMLLLAPTKTDASILIDDFLSSNIEQASEYELDSLQMARDLLEHGQIDAARATLESAVMRGEAELSVHQDLLEIYQHTNDECNFSKTFQKLDKKEFDIPSIWEEFVAYFDAPTQLFYG